MFGSFSVLLLGVLPSDVKAIRIAHRLIAFQIAVIGISSALVTVSWLKRGLEGDLPRMHRAHWLATVNVNCWLQLARLIKASYLSQRERLDQVWRIFGQFLMTTGILFFAGPFLGYFDDVPKYINTIYSFAAFVMVNWPRSSNSFSWEFIYI